MIFKNVKMIIKKIFKIIILPFIIVLFLLFPDCFASSWELYFSWTQIFNDVDYSSFKRELKLEDLQINSSSWTYQSINYKEDFNDLKEIQYQILLIHFFVWFFHLMWIFYTFKNDLLWKK
jgi:hypothetical protein